MKIYEVWTRDYPESVEFKFRTFNKDEARLWIELHKFDHKKGYHISELELPDPAARYTTPTVLYFEFVTYVQKSEINFEEHPELGNSKDWKPGPFETLCRTYQLNRTLTPAEFLDCYNMDNPPNRLISIYKHSQFEDEYTMFYRISMENYLYTENLDAVVSSLKKYFEKQFCVEKPDHLLNIHSIERTA